MVDGDGEKDLWLKDLKENAWQNNEEEYFTEFVDRVSVNPEPGSEFEEEDEINLVVLPHACQSWIHPMAQKVKEQSDLCFTKWQL